MKHNSIVTPLSEISYMEFVDLLGLMQYKIESLLNSLVSVYHQTDNIYNFNFLMVKSAVNDFTDYLNIFNISIAFKWIVIHIKYKC